MNRGTKKGTTRRGHAISGEEFKKEEAKRLKESGVKYITSGRGTGKIAFDEIKTKKKLKYKGKIHTGRGTGSQ
jgi:hypothetical protein